MDKRMTRFLSVCLSIMILISLSGCQELNWLRETDPLKNDKSEVKSYEAVLSPKTITPLPSQFTSGLNRYGLSVLLDLYDGENISVSPASLELALLMTATGATGRTRDEMLSSLQMTGIPEETSFLLSLC